MQRLLLSPHLPALAAVGAGVFVAVLIIVEVVIGWTSVGVDAATAGIVVAVTGVLFRELQRRVDAT